MLTIVANPRARHQVQHQNALAEGMSAHGIKSIKTRSETHIETDIVACWGWRIGKQLKESGHRVLVMERGYLGDRFSYASLAWNGLNGHAEFPVYPPDPSRYLIHNIELKPWKQGGDYALILGQVPNDASLQGQDMLPWYNEITQKVKEKYNMPVVFRQHPDLNKRGMNQTIKNAEKSTGTLEDALSEAAFTICFNSNSSVDSVIAGVPCIVGDRGSMAWEMCGHTIDDIVRPDRQAWIENLAWKQWNIDEIKTGKALTGILAMM